MILSEKSLETLESAFEYMLGADTDKSQQRNGVGFNKYDSERIHEDFDKTHEISKAFICKHAWRLARYEKQLVEKAGMNQDDLQNAFAALKPKSISEKVFCGGKQERKAGRPKQPEYRKVNPDGIHPKLKAMEAWACWKSIPNSGKEKPDKVPFSYQTNPLTGQEEVKLADCTNPATWMTYDNAMRLLNSSSAFKGLQLALQPTTPQDDEDRLVGIDLDEALLPDGNIKPEYKDWILRFNTLFELSPGDGVRGFCFGHFSTFGGKHKGNIEIYQERKWLTVTGQTIVDSAEDINNAQAAIEEFRSQYFTPYFEVDTSSLPKTNVTFTDEEIVANLEKWPNTERQETFKHYFCKGETIDHSSDDFDLCCMIRYWVQEEKQIDRIFRKSALMRDKWDEMRGSITYGQMTIRNALGCRTADTPIYMEHVIQPLPEKIDFNNFSISLPGFEVDSSGIYSIKADREGNEIRKRVANVPCVIVAKGINRDTGELLYKVLIKDGVKQEKTVWRRGSGLMKKSGVLELMEYGLEFQESDSNSLNEFFFKFITLYRDTLPMEMVASQSGWKDNFTQCVMGNKVISTEGVFDILQIENEASNFYSQVGDVNVWARDVDDIIRYPQIRYKAYAACGSLLLRKIDVANYIFDQCCSSGRLKSFSNKLVASFFGNPKKLQLDPKSTKLGIQKIAEACNDLPIFLDESSDNLAFVMELIFWFNNANTRVKSNKDSGLEVSENFCSGLFITGEDSIITESSKGGHQARRVAETHGVPSLPNGDPIYVAEEIKSRVKKAMRENYGHVGIMFVQELLPEMPNIEQIYAVNFKKLPDTGNHILSGRLKEYYTVILTAGQILERVFAKLGMTPANPLEIVTNYFEENVLSGVAEDDTIKILRMAYDLYVADKAHFGATAGSEFIESEKVELNEKYGWIDIKNGVTTINYRPQALKNFVIKNLGSKDGVNRYETTLTRWKDKKYINTTIKVDKKTGKEEILKTVRIRTANDDRQSVIQIPLVNFHIYLGLQDQEPETPAEDDSPTDDGDGEYGTEKVIPYTSDDSQVITAVVGHPSTSGGGFDQVTSITAAGLDDNIIIHNDGNDASILELMRSMGVVGDDQ